MTSEVASSGSTGLDAATLEYLGLSADPFECSHIPLYEGSGRGEMLIELLHQGGFAGQLLVVVGEEGSGKTSLLTAFCERLETGDRAEVIDVPFLSDAPSIVRQLERRFGLPASGDPANIDARLAAVRRAAQMVEDPDGRQILIFDDADHLDRDSLAVVIQLSQGASPSDRLRIVLFGEPALVSRLAQLNPAPAAMRAFVLEPLSPEALKSYLRLRLSAAGYAGTFPFRDEDIEHLWVVSAGNPGAVHEPARQLLSALAAPPPDPESFGLPVAHMSVVTILVGVLLIALFSRSPWDDTAPAPGQPILTATPPEQPKLPVTAADEQPLHASGIRGDRSTIADGEPGSRRDSAPEPSLAEVATLGFEPKKVGDIDGPKPAEPSASQAEVQPVFARPPERYALQVMALGSADAAREFVGRQPNAGDLSVIKAQREGKILHIVIVGDYASHEQARLAISRLPSEQRRAGPWPRSFASIQADMRGSGDN